MRLAVMQPYFLPYAGYFMLLRAVDRFVAFDDVQHIARGWVNRNRLLLGGRPHPFAVPLKKAAREARICDRELALDDRWRHAWLERVRHAYGRAPQYPRVRELLAAILDGPVGLADFLVGSLQLVCDYIGITTPITRSSSVELGVHGREKILALCRHFGADCYVNPRGGEALYAAKPFAAQGIALRFLHMHDVRYAQFGQTFVPNLSIMDVLMFNAPEACRALLARFSLVAPDQGGETA
jgi:hypothetical protein